MMRKLGLAVLLLLPGGALADIPPPPGYVEECQVSKVQRKDEFCTECRGAYYNDREFCDRRFEGDKLRWRQRCRTGGASVWTEVWCAPWKEKAPPPVPQPKPRK